MILQHDRGAGTAVPLGGQEWVLKDWEPNWTIELTIGDWYDWDGYSIPGTRRTQHSSKSSVERPPKLDTDYAG